MHTAKPILLSLTALPLVMLALGDAAIQGKAGRSTPVKQVSASAGEAFSCAVAGTPAAVFCWGANDEGQLGIGTRGAQHSRPEIVPIPQRSSADAVMTVSAGASPFACAVTGSGAVYCWGANRRGELGDSSVVSRPRPALVHAPTPFVSVEAGDGMACALERAGRIYCWGNNESGGLGVGDTVVHRTPTPVDASDRFSQISAGSAGASCAITTRHKIRCWGENGAGELGNGDLEPRARPTLILDRADREYTAVSVGNAFACAVSSMGRIFCWGANNVGQLGLGRAERTISSPTLAVPLPDDEEFVQVSAGFQSTCALTQSEHIYCWGSNRSGQLGGVAGLGGGRPQMIPGEMRYRSLSLGGGHGCAIAFDRQMYCWGDDLFGETSQGNERHDHRGVQRLDIPSSQN